MRRPLSVLVMAVTIAAGLPSTCLAAVIWPSPRPQTSHDVKLRKLAREVVAYARHQVGVPYSWGGTSPSTGFDCSGLVYASYRSIGKTIPRSSWDQLHVGRPVGFAGLRPGDLLFTEGGGHVELVVSKSAAISAPQTGERVRYVPLVQLRQEPALGACSNSRCSSTGDARASRVCGSTSRSGAWSQATPRPNEPDGKHDLGGSRQRRWAVVS